MSIRIHESHYNAAHTFGGFIAKQLLKFPVYRYTSRRCIRSFADKHYGPSVVNCWWREFNSGMVREVIKSEGWSDQVVNEWSGWEYRVIAKRLPDERCENIFIHIPCTLPYDVTEALYALKHQWEQSPHENFKLSDQYPHEVV